MNYLPPNEKNIEPRNKKGQAHGYHIIYDSYGTLWREGLFINNKEQGLWIWYTVHGTLWSKKYHI